MRENSLIANISHSPSTSVLSRREWFMSTCITEKNIASFCVYVDSLFAVRFTLGLTLRSVNCKETYKLAVNEDKTTRHMWTVA